MRVTKKKEKTFVRRTCLQLFRADKNESYQFGKAGKVNSVQYNGWKGRCEPMEKIVNDSFQPRKNVKVTIFTPRKPAKKTAK